jgi:phosphate transport system substrate-binding protein
MTRLVQPASDISQQPTRRGFIWLCVSLLATLRQPQGLARLTGQASRLVRTIFVAPLAPGDAGEAIRRQMVHDLSRASDVRLVDAPAGADATLAIHSVFWRSGAISVNPRAPGSGYAIYQGYASAELYDASRQPLWSYLATPSRFSFSGLSADLAAQLSASLQSALSRGLLTGGSAGTATNSKGMTLRAAGSTFPAPLYRRWFESFAADPGGFAVHYEATGSTAGMSALADGSVDLAASDIPPTGPEPDLLRVPTVVGGVVPIYNLPGLGRDLHLTGPLLADIYSGRITRWNDPRLRRENKGLHLPDAAIVVVHRTDGSGTTFVWTSYLAAASPEWQDKIGPSIVWPVGEGASGSEGVSELVRKTPNAIGYVELTYAIQEQLQYAAVQNPSGSFIKADLPSITAAAASARASGRSPQGSLLNTPASEAYSIAAFTWLLVPKAREDARVRAALGSFLRWMLTSGQKQCSSLAYAPLPREIASEELRQLNAWK